LRHHLPPSLPKLFSPPPYKGWGKGPGRDPPVHLLIISCCVERDFFFFPVCLARGPFPLLLALFPLLFGDNAVVFVFLLSRPPDGTVTTFFSSPGNSSYQTAPTNFLLVSLEVCQVSDSQWSFLGSHRRFSHSVMDRMDIIGDFLLGSAPLAVGALTPLQMSVTG